MTQIDRRAPLIEAMQQAHAKGISCQGCPGTCCTFRANSMQITPSEARDIFEWLQSNNEDMTKWKKSWQDCIDQFRLDHPIGRGTKLLRKTYTCPFFTGKELGCVLPASVKPYGCLSFNPQSQNKNEMGEGIDCINPTMHHKDEELEEIFPTGEKGKLPIPLALRSLL
jgi:hypothetical protein